jgi:Brp/Blh family beta-carotene 15,15'-monooxygenase
VALNALDSGRRLSPVGSSRLLGIALVAGWGTVALSTLAFALGLTVSPTLRYLPLVASVFLFGLPHGAVDHVTVPWARGEWPTSRWYALVGVVYAVLGGGYVALWFLAPAPAFVLFVLLTWAHWGQGDVYPLSTSFDETHLRSRRDRLRAAIVRGALPMVVPLVAFPDRYRAVADTLVGLFGATASTLDPVFSPSVRVVLGAGLAALTLAHLVSTRRSAAAGGRRAWLLDAGESALLWAFFLVVPPVVAVGVYFCFWHSLRHVVRVASLDPRSESPSPLAAVARFARTAAPLTVAALVPLGVLAAVAPNAPGDLPSAVGLYLVVVAALTLPHVVFASWVDRVQGVWSP